MYPYGHTLCLHVALSLNGTVPVLRGGHRDGMRAESDQARLCAIMFAAQQADVQFLANAAHCGKPRIADMAVVRPDNGFGLRSLCSKQQFERFEHMRDRKSVV